jgi:hypothetical protein
VHLLHNQLHPLPRAVENDDGVPDMDSDHDE